MSKNKVTERSSTPITDLQKKVDKRKAVDDLNSLIDNDESSSFSSGQIELDTQSIVEKTKTTYEYYSKEEGTSKWICNECNMNIPRKYSSKTSKSILDYHLEHDHEIITPKQKRNMSNMSKENSDKIDRSLLIFIIACCLPFMLVESNALKEFIACLNPKYQVPCRKKFRSLLTDLYREKVEFLKSKLLTLKVLSITTDGWTSCQNYTYISATAHFIDGKTNFISFC